ncbi:MAG: response regulator transcription factor, partial [Cyclobacteriaceae bacterium]
MKKINVLIADDHQIVLEGLTLLLQNEEDIHIVDVVADGKLALKVMEYEKVDVAVVDISMPGLDGVETTKAIKAQYPDTGVLILTMHNEGSYITELIKAGASGYILKNRGKEELVYAIRKVAAGGEFYSESVTQTLISGIKNGNSAREKKNDL